MVYSSHFVLAVLVDGKPAKELANGVVPIPFSKCYSLRFRNKNNRRAVVKFTIDDENVSGNGYIIPANSFIDIHRHFSKDATFKFVGLDSPEAIDNGKNGPNLDGSKGVIEAKFYLEKHSDPLIHHHYHYDNNNLWWLHPPQPIPWTQPQPIPWTQPYGYTQCSKGSSMNVAMFESEMNCAMPPATSGVGYTTHCAMPPATSGVGYASVDNLKSACVSLQEGCTVEGSSSGQTFISEHINLESDYVMLRCVLKGFAVNTCTQEIYCANCGAKKPRAADNFCGVCGRKF